MTDLFPDAKAQPRLYTVPAGLPFAATFAEGLVDRCRPHPPQTLARTRVLLSGRKEITILRDAFRSHAGSLFLPNRHAMRDLTSDTALSVSARRPARLPARTLVLARLVAEFRSSTAAPADGKGAIDLANALVSLLEEIYFEGLDPATLKDCVPDDLAVHWQESARFLDIIGKFWPEWLESKGLEDPALSYRLAVDALIDSWRSSPPDTPVLVAGSTLTDDTTARLAEAVTALPQGAVVLPALDLDLDPAAWAAIGTDQRLAPEHPQYTMKRFLERLGIDRSAVLPFTSRPEPRPQRTRFLAQALRPAPVTDAWTSQAEEYEDIAEAAMEGVELLEAESAEREAMAVAMTLREAVESQHLCASLVTEDDGLRRRVLAKCAMWGLDPQYSRGIPLADTAAGRLCLLSARVALEPPDFAPLLSLLKNSLVRSGGDRTYHLSLLSRTERRLRKQNGQYPGLDGLHRAVEDAEGAQDLLAWLADIEQLLSPLAAFASRKSATFTQMLDAHKEVINLLTGGPSDIDSTTAMIYVRDFFRRVKIDADLRGSLPPDQYPGSIAALLSRERWQGRNRHPRITLRGNLESRYDPPELVILGGLNEEEAPGGRGKDVWLNRAMRDAVGLPSRQRDIGTIAHDFSILFAAPRVILTRAITVNEEPTVASRWLLRLTNLLEGTGPAGQRAIAAMRRRGSHRLALAERISRHDGPPEPVSRPEPRPPAIARPRKLSATSIETLVKDPYAIYARYVLGLRELERLGSPPDARARGTLMHEVMQEFLDQSKDIGPDRNQLSAILQSAEESAFQGLSRWPWLERLWRGRMQNLSDWLAQIETSDRDDGWRPVGVEAEGSLDLGGGLVVTARADRIDARKVVSDTDREDDGRQARKDGDHPTQNVHSQDAHKADSGYPGKSDSDTSRREESDVAGESDIEQQTEYRVADYKTGSNPRATDLDTHALQLRIAALILKEGGFQGMDPGSVNLGQYISLRPDTASGPYQGRIQEDELKDIDAFRSRLTKLMQNYADETLSYISHAMPDALQYGGAYDHLARVAEWTSAGDDNGD